MKLPEEFCVKMHKLLGAEYQEFLASYEDARFQGLRVNTLKISVEEFKKISPFSLTTIPWSKSGFYINEEERPAKHPYYHAGLYYIQEPSAMAPVQVLDVQSGDRVLDLCAAPGGKSTQIAAELKGSGFLISNDLSLSRTKALTKNIELFGATNVIVLNERPDKLALEFPEFFSKILIDAPCSGEGMFRKDPDAPRNWGIYSTDKCVLMQQDILNSAGEMLAPGGMMVYSTCTFNPEENEKMIDYFLKSYTDFELVDISLMDGWEKGRTDWAGGNHELSKTVRLWPYKLRGEGHFVALLRKKGVSQPTVINIPLFNEENEKKELTDLIHFINDNLTIELKGRIEAYGDRLYLQPSLVHQLRGIKVVRPGLYLGTLKKKRFEPSHGLALALKKESFKRTVNLDLKVGKITNYLKGETLNVTGERGWTGVLVNGFPVGWGKQLEGILKNYYPKGWRMV